MCGLNPYSVTPFLFFITEKEHVSIGSVCRKCVSKLCIESVNMEIKYGISLDRVFGLQKGTVFQITATEEMFNGGKKYILFDKQTAKICAAIPTPERRIKFCESADRIKFVNGLKIGDRIKLAYNTVDATINALEKATIIYIGKIEEVGNGTLFILRMDRRWIFPPLFNRPLKIPDVEKDDGKNVIVSADSIYETNENDTPCRLPLFCLYSEYSLINKPFGITEVKDFESETYIEHDFETEPETQGNFEIIPALNINTPAELKDFLQPNKGMQGRNNSCYLDACIFALFFSNSVCDEVLHKAVEDETARKVQSVLREKIVNELRQHHFVPAKNIELLRDLLAKIQNAEGWADEEKDAEHFIHFLFRDILNATPFYELNIGTGFCYQLFVEKNENLQFPTIQQLLVESMMKQNARFKTTPNCLAILMPRCQNRFKVYDRIMPSPLIDVTDLIDEMHTSNSEGQSQSITMELTAIICIDVSHYVAFVRTGQDETAPWVFADSMHMRNNNRNTPFVGEVVNADRLMSNDVVKKFAEKTNNELTDYAKRLYGDSYMALYVAKRP